jgi:DNA (cytosine-5)-methyltransferase 1
MSQPRLLDLFCGAGGCAKGYQRAGFYVVGVDVKSQPHYCGDEFIEADALEVLREEDLRGIALPFDAIHASPPCQGYSALKGLTTFDYPLLVASVRDLLRETGLPYAIENVMGAPLHHPFRLCGSSFGLRVWRHRLFETNWPIGMVPLCSHQQHPEPLDVTGTGGPSSKPRSAPGGGLSRKPANLAEAREAMGIDWMTRPELAEAIPPAYCEFIGHQLMTYLRAESEAA